MAGRKKSVNNYIVRSYNVTRELDGFINMVAMRESELNNTEVSKSDILRRCIRKFEAEYEE